MGRLPRTDAFDASAIREIVFVGFPDVELLDLTGPYEVFSSAIGWLDEEVRPRLRMATASSVTFSSRNGLEMKGQIALSDVDRADLLVVPGGRGVRQLLEDEAFLKDLLGLLEEAHVVLSVCTGSLLLAKLGVLDGRAATSHHTSLEQLRKLAPTANVHGDRRWVEDGHFVIAAGVSAGLDAAFHVVERLWGAALAQKTADDIEYPWPPGNLG
ncbi:MAG: DJ-1/PfpI family protein [Planctomycetota bacterium]|jgi:transcriptional regulator GlxA family with amidase domain|nr:DJ-1/PfpI family protein [Planctomycetota bacterium]